MEAISVAEFLTQQLALSPKTQLQIATEAGYDKPNIITMFKQGRTKLPITAVVPMARAIDADPVHLLRLALAEYQPDNWAVLHDLLGERLVSQEELTLLELVREAAGGVPIDVTDAKVAENLRACVEAIARTVLADRQSAVRAVDGERGTSPGRAGREGPPRLEACSRSARNLSYTGTGSGQ